MGKRGIVDALYSSPGLKTATSVLLAIFAGFFTNTLTTEISTPNRNWLLDPRRNTAWDGPYLYDLSNRPEGYVVRANDDVALLFDTSGKLTGSLIAAGETNYNLFDRHGKWMAFL